MVVKNNSSKDLLLITMGIELCDSGKLFVANHGFAGSGVLNYRCAFLKLLLFQAISELNHDQKI